MRKEYVLLKDYMYIDAMCKIRFIPKGDKVKEVRNKHGRIEDELVNDNGECKIDKFIIESNPEYFKFVEGSIPTVSEIAEKYDEHCQSKGIVYYDFKDFQKWIDENYIYKG